MDTAAIFILVVFLGFFILYLIIIRRASKGEMQLKIPNVIEGLLNFQKKPKKMTYQKLELRLQQVMLEGM